jgi:hypothetical protein
MKFRDTHFGIWNDCPYRPFLSGHIAAMTAFECGALSGSRK